MNDEEVWLTLHPEMASTKAVFNVATLVLTLNCLETLLLICTLLLHPRWWLHSCS